MDKNTIQLAVQAVTLISVYTFLFFIFFRYAKVFQKTLYSSLLLSIISYLILWVSTFLFGFVGMDWWFGPLASVLAIGFLLTSKLIIPKYIVWLTTFVIVFGGQFVAPTIAFTVFNNLSPNHVYAVKDISNKSELTGKIFHYITDEDTYLFRTDNPTKPVKPIKLKFNFSWEICDIDAYSKNKYLQKRVFEEYMFVALKDGIRDRAARSTSFSKLNTPKNIRFIINDNKERVMKLGVCVKSLKLSIVNGS